MKIGCTKWRCLWSSSMFALEQTPHKLILHTNIVTITITKYLKGLPRDLTKFLNVFYSFNAPSQLSISFADFIRLWSLKTTCISLLSLLDYFSVPNHDSWLFFSRPSPSSIVLLTKRTYSCSNAIIISRKLSFKTIRVQLYSGEGVLFAIFRTFHFDVLDNQKIFRANWNLHSNN